MATVWLRLRADVRVGWRTLAVLALLLGLVGGVVLTAAAGARRTDTAYPRLLSWASATQVDILPFSGEPAPRYYAALARLPEAAAVSAQILYQIALPARHGVPQLVEAFSSPDGTMGVSADRVKIVQGRMFTSRAPGQAVIDPQLASLVHLRPGGTLHLVGIPDNPRTGEPELSRAIPLAFRVTAIAVFDTQIVPGNASFSGPMVLLSPPFTATRAARSIYVYGDEAGVRLRPGASMTAFLRDAETLARRFPATGGKLGVISLSDQVTATERAIRPQAVALAIFAVLAGLVGLAVIGQLLARQMALDSAEFPILRTLGMTRASLAVLALARLAAVTFAGAVLAVGVAVAASPLMPIGPARLAEPAPGTEVNLAVLGAGLVAVAVLPLAVLVPAAWRAAGREGGPLAVAEPAAPARPSRLAWVAGLAGSVPGSVGVRMAFEPGRGRTAVPVRSAVAGVIVAVAAVVAAVVFGASLITMVGTPHQYGQNWDQQFDLEFGAIPAGLGAKLVSADPAVTQYAAGDYGELTVDGKIVAAIGINPVRGGGYLTLLSGRAPAAPGEIALGAQTLRALHRQLGQTVQVVVDRVSAPGPAAQYTMRIVGVAVLPSFSRGGFASTDLGTGAVVPAPVLSEPFAPAHCTGHETCYNFFLFVPVPARHQPDRRDSTAERAGDRPWMPGLLLYRELRSAAGRHQERRRHPRHPAGAGRRPGPAGGRHASPRAAHRPAPPPPRAGRAEDPGPGPLPAAARSGLAGHRARRGRAGDRAAAGGAGRPVGLGRVRRVGRGLRRGRRPGPARAADRAGHPGPGQPDRRRARLERRPRPTRLRTAHRVIRAEDRRRAQPATDRPG